MCGFEDGGELLFGFVICDLGGRMRANLLAACASRGG